MVFNGSGADLRRKPSILDSPLPEHFETLCHDQRGLGQTDQPDTAYSMQEYADDAHALLQKLNWTRCHVLGVSFGGMVAQEFALRHPTRVDRLVLACTSSGGAGGSSYPLHELAELTLEERALQSLELADRRMNEEWRLRHPEAVRKILRTMETEAESANDESEKKMGAERQMEARKTHDTWSRLHRLKMPVLCCGGLHDGIAPQENMQRLTDQIPQARLEIFDGGHLFLRQDPEAWRSIIQFLNSPEEHDFSS